MATSISCNATLIMKLISAGLMLNTAKAKLEMYVSQNIELIEKVQEDYITYELIEEFYKVNNDELVLLAEESLSISNEFEAFCKSNDITKLLGEAYDRETD